MSAADLFGESSPVQKSSSKLPTGRVRVQRAERGQVELRPSCLEDLLPEEHRARVLWDAVEDLDLSGFYVEVGSREGSAGRPAIDPQILVALWLYATSEGVGSARELARLCEMHDAYRWLCGGVSVNYHTLSDFRVTKGRALDELMTQILGTLMHEGIVRLRRVAQDGTRVRANAGAASFRRKRSLKECLREAREQIRQVKAQLDGEGGQATKRMTKARLRAAEDRRNRVKKALRHVEDVRRIKLDEDAKEQARASTTDPECRVMKMPDGGFRPAYNLQFATDVEADVIVGVHVTNKGSDRNELEPMLAQIGRRTEQLPKEHLVDGGYLKHESIEKAEARGVKIFAPIQRREDIDTHKPREDDGPGVSTWRRRMGRERSREIYKDRGATAERVNADLKTWRGLNALPVRGLGKVLCVALWSAIAFNLMRWIECVT